MSQKYISERISLHKDWLRTSGDMKMRQLEYLKKDFLDDNLYAVDNISDSLGTLALYYAVRGEVNVWEGNDDGWRDISKSILYRYWSLKLVTQSSSNKILNLGMTRAPNLSYHVGATACLLCYSIANNNQEIYNFASRTLNEMATREKLVDQGFWKQRAFEPFVLSLDFKHREDVWPSNIEQEHRDVFSEIIKYWDEPLAFKEPILDACEYHCIHMEDADDQWGPAFDEPPFDLIPIEILAIYQIRGQQLEKENIEHPLLKTVLSYPHWPSIEEDSILLEAQDVYWKFFQREELSCIAMRVVVTYANINPLLSSMFSDI